MAIYGVERVRAKRIRRRLEDGVACTSYLCDSHDRREAELLASGMRRLSSIMEQCRRLQVEISLLVEMDETDENPKHRELHRGYQECNRELTAEEMAACAAAPVAV